MLIKYVIFLVSLLYWYDGVNQSEPDLTVEFITGVTAIVVGASILEDKIAALDSTVVPCIPDTIIIREPSWTGQI